MAALASGGNLVLASERLTRSLKHQQLAEASLQVVSLRSTSRASPRHMAAGWETTRFQEIRCRAADLRARIAELTD
jgi:hypothetical protein